jgi:hypothetical protein
VTDHRLERIDFRRPARFTAVCTCGWRSEPMLSAGLAGALWDRHVEQVPDESPKDAPVVDVDLTLADAARELHAQVLPAIKDAVRGHRPLQVIDEVERMELTATVLGERERRLARAVRREWARLVEDPTSRQRATVIVGLVELGERARAHLGREVPRVGAGSGCAPD